MWLNQLKAAVVTKDTKRFALLLEEVPKLENPQEIEEALYLIEAAKGILEEFKVQTQASMVQLQKNKAFLNSARGNSQSRFDITS